MALPSFIVTGTLLDLLGNVAGGEIVGNGLGGATPATVTFTSNVPINQFVRWDDDGSLHRVPPVVATVNGDGEILRNGDPVQLLAEDAGLSVSGLQWTASATGMKPFTFDAPADGGTIDLGSVAPAPNVAIVGIASLPVSGLVDATTYMKGMLTGADDAAEARAILGVDLTDSDEIDWYANFAAFPVTGVTDQLYGARDTGDFYRWSGSVYVWASNRVLSTGITDSGAAGRAVITAVDAAAARAATGDQVCATIAALKGITSVAAALGAVDGHVRVLGYYAAGDGGGGIFRWDSTDTTSTDNGGTIITPTGALASSGRWKRVYEGEVNARWFGVNPSQADNTAALQKCVDWVGARAYPEAGGVVFIPQGWYTFTFPSASTITVANDNVLIRGEGKGSRFLVTGHARPSQIEYFFTYAQSGRGQGGGVRDVNFYGNSMLKWCIKLNTWRDAAFENISAFDVHAGIGDAEATHTSLYGENITVRNQNVVASAGSVLTQYGWRFRNGAGASAKTWSDCWINNVAAIGCWDAGVILDGVDRFDVRNIVAANNNSLSDTIDGTAKAGCKTAVHVANTNTVNPIGGGLGNHTIDNVYLESLHGSETPTNNVAVLIDILPGVANSTQGCAVSNVHTSGNVGKVRFYDANGFGRVHDNFFDDPRAALHHDFGTKSNGTPSSTMDTGQVATPFTLSSTSGTPDAWSVLSGKVGFAAYGSTVATSDGVNHAVYWPVDLGAPITRVKVPVTWPAASVGGSQFTIVLPSAAWTNVSLPRAGIHFAASGNGQWHCSPWNGSSEDAHYMDDAMFGRFTAQDTGVEGVFEFFIDRDASTLQVFFPDGSFTPAVYHADIAAYTGSRVVFELFVSSVVNDIPPSFGEFVADTDVTVLPSDTSVVTLPDVARLVAGAGGGSLALTTTAGGTTTLTASSAKIQEFAGSANQTVVMPSTDVAAADDPFYIVNASTGVVTVNASAGGFMAALASGETARIQALGSTPTAPGSWLTLLYLTRDGTQVVRNKTISAANNTITLRPNEVGEFWTPPGFSFASGNYYFFNSSAVAQAVAPTNNRLMFSWVVIPKAVTLASVFAEVTSAGAASSVIRLGIYNDDGNFAPGTLVADFGTIAGDSVTVQEITGLSQVLPAGGYWIAAVAQSAGTVPTWRAVGTSGMPLPTMFTLGTSLPVAGAAIYGKAQASVTGALPSTAAAVLASSGCARVGFKVA